jgi:hypothetical protein
MNKNRIEGRYGTTSWHNTVTAPAAIAAIPPAKLDRMDGVKPVSTVVWDPWLALAVSHGDPIRYLGVKGS